MASPVRDQGQSGTCATFAIVANFEFRIKNPKVGTGAIPYIDLSEAHITHAVEKIRGDCVPGLATMELIYYLHYNGCVEEGAWPYDERYVCHPNPPNLGGTRRFYWDWSTTLANTFLFNRSHGATIKSFDTIASGLKTASGSVPIDPIKAEIAQNASPAVVDVPVFWNSDGYNAGWESGDVTMPTRTMLKSWLAKTATIGDVAGSAGWHCIQIVGYDDNTQRFEFKNSWGRWGKGGQGYGTIPYDYISAYSRTWSTAPISFSNGIGPPPYGI